MQTGPVQTLRVAAAAARRALLRDLTFAAGRGLGLAGAGALMLIGASKLGLRTPDWPIVLGSCLGVAIVGAAIWALMRRWSVMRGAEELDVRLDLKDRLSTAVALGAGPPGPFTDWAIADAERVAPTVKLDEAVPLRLDWTWGTWPLVAAGAIAVAMFVPVRPHHAVSPRPEPTQAERTRATEQLRQTADAIRQGLPDESVQPATAAQLKALEQLESELAQGRLDPEQAAVQAARQVEDMARRLESDAGAAQRQADALRERFAKAAAESAGKPDASAERTSPFMDAIQRGDIKTAAEMLEQAAQNEPNLTPEERRQLARDMDQLAQAIEADKQSQTPDGRTPPPERADGQRTDAGQPDERRDQPKPGAPADKSQPPDSHAPQAPRPEPKPEREAGAQPESGGPSKAEQEREREQVEQLRRALRDAAREAREEPKPPPEGGKQRDEKQAPAGEQKPPEQPGSEETKPDQTTSAEGQQGATGDQKRDQPSDQKPPNGDKQGQRPDAGKSEPKDQGQPKGQPKGQPGATGQTEGAKEQPSQTNPDGKKPGSSQGNQPRPGRQPSLDQKQPGDAQAPDGQPGSTGATGATSRPEGTQPGGSNPRASPDGEPKGNSQETGQKTPEGSGLERAARELRRLTDGAGQRDKEKARQAREMAKKLLEQSTPEQREQYRKLAQEFAREHGDGGPGLGPAPLTMQKPPPLRDSQTSPIDARRPATVSGNDKPPERTIAEWYSDKPADRGQQAAAPADALKQAADGAERAIENQQVPARYQELVRRVFRRYSEQAPPK